MVHLSTLRLYNKIQIISCLLTCLCALKSYVILQYGLLVLKNFKSYVVSGIGIIINYKAPEFELWRGCRAPFIF